MLEDHGKGISSIAVFEAMNKVVEENAVIAVDVGNNTYSFGRYFKCKAQSVLMSGYLGSIGFALPAAMGAWAAVKGKRPVWSVSGDGGIGQYLADLTTWVRYDMNITHVLVNNSELGKISKEQRAAELDVWKTNLVNPNFAEYANNCGALGIRVEKVEDLVPALEKAKAHNGPALVDIVCDVDLI
jgi:pyruvate oxidase